MAHDFRPEHRRLLHFLLGCFRTRRCRPDQFLATPADRHGNHHPASESQRPSLSLLEGPSSAVLVTLLVLASQGLPVIEGGMICGGLFLIIIGAFKWLKWLSSLFTSHVVGVILMLVALNLLSFMYPLLIGISKSAPHGDLSILALPS